MKMSVEQLKIAGLREQIAAAEMFAKSENFNSRGLVESASRAEDTAQRHYDTACEVWDQLEESGADACLHESLAEIFDCVQCAELLDTL